MRQKVSPSHSGLLVAPVVATAVAIAASLSRTSSAGVVALYADSYVVQEGGQLFRVIDLYVDLPSTAYQVYQVTSTGGGSVSLIGAPSWFHSDASGSCPDGGTWLPSVSLAYPSADSFLTIGLPANGLPNFTIGNPFLSASPGCEPTLGPNAGWIDSNPTSLQGFASDVLLSNAATLESATMIGRFTVASPLGQSAAIHITNFLVTYGPGFSPPSFVSFDEVTFSYVPGPAAAFPLFLLAAGARRSRRARQRNPAHHGCDEREENSCRSTKDEQHGDRVEHIDRRSRPR
jgi:hypothetical protein